MLLSNEQYGEVLQVVMRDGLSASKAVEVADLCNQWVATHERCPDCAHDICEGCKHEEPPEWDHSLFNAERVSENVVRYIKRAESDVVDEGIDPTLAMIFLEIPHLVKNAKAAVTYTKELEELPRGLNEVEFATLQQAATRVGKKLWMATDLLAKQDEELKQKDNEIDQLQHQLSMAEDRAAKLLRQTRPVRSAQAEPQPKPIRKAGINPFKSDRMDFGGSIESVSYFDVDKIQSDKDGFGFPTGRY
jgi:hypothetical protein